MAASGTFTEDELGRKWDRCLTDVVLKIGNYVYFSSLEVQFMWSLFKRLLICIFKEVDFLCFTWLASEVFKIAFVMNIIYFHMNKPYMEQIYITIQLVNIL